MPTISDNTHIADSVYSQAGIAQNAATTSANSQACTTNLGTTVNLSLVNGVYIPGVYCTTGTASIGTAGITLSGDGIYIFKINGALKNTPSHSMAGTIPVVCTIFLDSYNFRNWPSSKLEVCS